GVDAREPRGAGPRGHGESRHPGSEEPPVTTDQTVDAQSDAVAPETTPDTEVRTAADAVPTESPTGSRRAASVQAVDASFADFDVRPEIVAALAAAGITQ